MKKVASKSVLMMLILLLTLSSFSTTIFALEKKDEKGEILNLPPVVDFEVKEKRKVDVVVDVGDTNYTMDQINSMVNEQLRPKLQASGLDYKVHVEKSSEGADKIYYFSYIYRNGASEYDLYYYDVMNEKSVFVKEAPTGVDPRNSTSIYDPINDVIITTTHIIPLKQSVTYFNNGRINVARPGHSYPIKIAKPIMTQDGHYAFNITGTESFGTDSTYGMAAIKALDLVNNTTSALSVRINDYGYNYRTMDEYVDNEVLFRTNGGDTRPYSNILSIRNSLDTYYDPQATSKYEAIEMYVGSYFAFFKKSGEIIYQKNTVNNAGTSTTSVETVIYDPKTKTKRTFELGGRSGTSYMYNVEDNQLIYKGLSDTAMYFYEDYTDESTKTLISATSFIPITHAGNVVVSTPNSTSLSFLNIDTKTVKTVSGTNAYGIVKYPKWYTAKKRIITDIIDEVPYRTDAEKYYVRIDDSGIPHLDRQSSLGNTITQLAKQQIDYISIGNSSNEVVTKKLQTALGSTQRYNISGINTAFGNIGSYITDRKNADLHILMAQPGVTDASITTAIKDLTTQLQKSNVIVTPQYIKGTNSSTLYELLNQVNWRDDRNNYVLWLNQGTMSEFNDPLVEEEVSLLLKGNYTFFTAMGSANNKVANESLIASNNGNGYFFAGTNISYMTGELKKYVEATAVKNPKRVSDTLVLNYDSTTGDYSSDVMINTYYEDFEKDRKINERFLTTHDPSVYENNTGVMEGIGQYQESPTTKFSKVGLYEMVVQVQDDPTANIKFSNYNLWSLDSLSRLVLYVHRAPVAEFSAIVNSSRRLTIQDYSYDLDRYSQRNKGVTTWVWKWKKVDDADWTVGKPPSQLQANTDYFVALKVKDIDGAWSSEVVKYVTTNPFNQPPVALFTIDPKSVSWSKQAVVTDRSYDPDGDPIITRDWKVYRENKLILSSGTTTTFNQIKAAAVAAGLDALGNYKLTLRVQDSQNLWSETYTDFLEIINYPPIADFEPLADTYRDTVNKVTNLTANPDQDDDKVTYQWTLKYGNKTYNLGTAQHPSFKIKDRGLGKLAVGSWQLELKASDPLGASSYMTHAFHVVNQVPTTTIISGRSTGYINEPYAYTSSRSDADTEDVASLQTFWRLTSPSGKVREWYTQNISITYVEKGSYVLENWVVDQLDAKSEVDKKNITILNLAPIPGFTMNPNPTYRGTDVNFVSKATDLDGYVDKQKYEYLADDGSIITLSASGDFTRSFQTVGILNIQQTVTDNDGATALIVQPITIINRLPNVEVTTPTATSPATATTFTSLTPTIHWKMTDADNDPQVKYELVLKSMEGTILQTSSVVAGSAQSFIIPSNWNLIENKVYRVTVRSFDGYDWSVYATDKYFNIITNQPPTAGFTWSPAAIWEGDHIQLKHQVDDQDGDMLLVRYKVTAPDGTIAMYPQTSNYSLTKAQYNSDAFSIHNAAIGKYKIEQTVSDGKSDTVLLTQFITVNELDVIGEVVHTDLWEQYRLSYNQSATTNGAAIWNSDQFYGGEKFILKASTTNTGSSSNLTGITYAREVTVSLLNKYGTTLLRQNATKWTGELWHIEFSDMKKGMYDVIFVATYSNGIVKEHTVTIEIIGKASSFVSLHRWK